MEEQELFEQLRAAFEAQFGAVPAFVARAPGRVNLIGEHTDYNGGFVLPVAINRFVMVAGDSLPHNDRIRVYSVDFNNEVHFALDNIQSSPEETESWSNYVRGVAWALGQRGELDLAQIPGAMLAITGNVPKGAGMSSSAAIEVASALAFYALAGREPGDLTKVALTCQYAENKFVGVNSGIMDQFISALGQEDAALLIDTRSLEYRAVPLGFAALGLKLVAVDSAVPRKLGATAYNQRRRECEEAVQILAQKLNLPSNAQLRDVTYEQFTQYENDLPETLRKRARHVISEDERVLQAVALMEKGLSAPADLQAFGQLLYASHNSLKNDYEVSCAELDLLVDLASRQPGVVGARMTGAGFGGCTVNVVAESELANFEKNVVEVYRQQTGLPAQIHVCSAVSGGRLIRTED